MSKKTSEHGPEQTAATPALPASMATSTAPRQAVDPRVQAIRQDRIEQSAVQTRFDASGYRRKEYDRAGKPVAPRPRRAP